MKKVITISREFGSGGHDIGMEVAKRLNIPFYDQEIVDKAVAESGFTKEFIEEHGEYSTLSSVLLGTSTVIPSGNCISTGCEYPALITITIPFREKR